MLKLEISEFKETDLPEIVDLMRRSLGESLMPKSEAFFRWKHLQNVFGKSKVLLAKADGKVVGLRTFMYWNWFSGNQKTVSVRAVDTATDPDYQGKGIFSKLTLAALEECQKDGASFVFNTPNSISMRGYLKLGWQVAGRLPVCIGANFAFPIRYSASCVDNVTKHFDISDVLDKFPSNWALPEESHEICTRLDIQYLRWRYAMCPHVRYGMAGDSKSYGFVFRLRNFNNFIELRFCEIWVADNPAARRDAIETYQAIKGIVRPALITSSRSGFIHFRKNKAPYNIGPIHIGPVLTIRPIANIDLAKYLNFTKWQPSLGSVELF